MMQEQWLMLAKSLPLGASRRRNCHVCATSSSNTVKISHTSDGYRWYCFSCGAGDSVRHGLRSISLLSLHASDSEFSNTPMALPHDFTTEIPEDVAVWMYKSSVYKDTAFKYNIGWSAKMQRIILPVYNKERELVYIQARAVRKGHKPKYLNRASTYRADIMFHSMPSQYTLYPDVFVVTEAILSAIRVGVYAPTVSTLGSKITDEMAYQLSMAEKVLLWYDPDAAGRSGAVKAFQKLKQIGTEIVIINTDLKPKQYTNKEIRDILWKVALTRSS